MRARYPDQDGFVERDGLKIAYAVYGSGPRDVVFTPIDPIVHSRVWKGQVPYLSRYARVVVIDPRGNGRSDRTSDPGLMTPQHFVDDTLAVMDEVGVERALLVGLCSSAWTALVAAAQHPDRVTGVVSMATWAPYLTPPMPWRAAAPWDVELDTDEGWAKDNKFYWQRDYRGFTEFFFDQLLPEPHSTKQWEGRRRLGGRERRRHADRGHLRRRRRRGSRRDRGAAAPRDGPRARHPRRG